MTLKKKLFFIFSNAVIIIILLAIGEIIFRFIPRIGSNEPGAFDVNFHPYIMWTSDLAERGEYILDTYSKKKYQAFMDQNNLNFASEYDYDFVPGEEFYQKFRKDENTKVVLITGGSAIHGHSASDNKHTIAGQMETYLNKFQSKYKYKVINMAMGSWIAFQEFICLALFGKRFNPDWIVVIDGINDISSFADHSAGVGNPMFWASMIYTLDNKKERSKVERFLIKNSMMYQLFTKTSPDDLEGVDGLELDPDNQDFRFRIKIDTDWKDINKQVDFYIYSQKAILDHFEEVKFILSLQPKAEGFGDLFYNYNAESDIEKKKELENEINDKLEEIYKGNADKKVQDVEFGTSEEYFFNSAFINLNKLVNDYAISNKRDVKLNRTEECFTYNPDIEFKDRRCYFTDSNHFNVEGQELLGIYYAMQIIDRDFTGRQSSSAVRQLMEEMLRLIENVEGKKRDLSNLLK